LFSSRKHSGLRLAATFAALAVLAAGAGAGAEVTATHDTVISFDSRVFPRSLSRTKPTPVGIRIEGHLKARSKREPAPMTRLELGIQEAGRLSRRGLPVCDIARIDPASSARALEVCPGAQIGHGRIRAQSTFPGQPHFFVDGRVVILNGRLRDGSPAILLHVFNARPPTSFVFPLTVSRRPGRFSTVLTANVKLNRWSRITDFDLVLHRIYRYRGQRRSLLSASCPAPEGFSIGIGQFVRATLHFGDGTKRDIPVVGSCRVAE
jgi:hypothetical protein